jgi:WYL_2, Sm-like SH3 beta-barrel fold
MGYQEILDLLHNNDCEVTFVKVDGSVRIMPCTLRAQAVPAKLTESARTKAKNESVINAWCLDKLEWRSFRVANVTDIKVL